MNQNPFPSRPVLLVDDEIEMLKSFQMALRTGGINHIVRCNDGREVMSILSKQEVEVILLDLMMPFISGEELLPVIVQEFPEIPVIVVTGNNEVETAVKCLKANALDYIVKPVEKSRLVSSVKSAIERRALEKEPRILRKHTLSDTLENPDLFSEIITNDKKMLALFHYAESIGRSSEPVFITGETGVGKELMAKAIHTLSNRRGPSLSVNVAGIDNEIFSDTLFGHVKGAFTGADRARQGLVEKASGGSLLLDEIGDLSPDLQIKLLRLLQEREYFPLGSDVPKMTDARIIVTTNQDLQMLQKAGRFRKDLYYRLCAHHIHIPPLRERQDDIPLLIDHFLKEASQSFGKKRPSPPSELLTLLSNYHFPGNIRELKAMIYDAMTRHKSKMLSLSHFKKHIAQLTPFTETDSNQFPSGDVSRLPASGPLPTLKQANRILMTEAMKRSNNNQSMAARLLGITRQRLGRHLKSVLQTESPSDHRKLTYRPSPPNTCKLH